MTKRALKYILLVLSLIGVADCGFAAAVEAVAPDQLIARPVMEYKADKMRDPFRTYLLKEEPKPVVVQENTELPAVPQLDITRLKVQGIIWGVKTPQAIINNNVLQVGDLIEGAEIISIEKKGISLSFNGTVFNLTPPGLTPVRTETK